MEETKKTSQWTAKKTMMIVVMGLLTAIVVVLQIFASGIWLNPTTCITLVLAPTIVGAALYGWKAGAWLGAVFSAVVLISGQASFFMAMSIPGTIITVMLKGTLAGIAGGAMYRLVEKKNRIAAVVAAGIVTPLVNTGVYILGCLIFFNDYLQTGAAADGRGMFAYIIFAMVGMNFVIELAINLVLSSAIVLILNLAQKKLHF